MAMNKGIVTVNPSSGEATGAGAAKEVFDALDATIDYQGVTGAPLGTARKQLADIANAVAVLIDHIKNNASVGVSIDIGSTANGVTAGSASVPVTGTASGTVQ
jgi:hypothetical protein